MPCIPSHVGLIGKAWKTLLAFVLVVSLIPSSALANIELANVGDAATAAPQVQARSYTWLGADAATTVEMGRVTVEGADLSALPDPDSTGACAEATRLEAGDAAYDKVAAAVAKRWSGDPALLRVYSFRVLDGSGSEVAVPEGAEVTFEYTEMLNGGVAPRAFSLAGDGTLRELETTQGANYVEGMMFDVAAHGADPACVAFVDTTGLEEKKQLEAGVYTVDANLYVPGYQAPIGSNAYMTTNDFPPVNKGRKNGELLVGEDGELTVTVYPVHEIFTLQDIHDGDDAHIESIERGGFASSYGSHPDRITKLVVKLDNDNGTYKFEASVVCVTRG